MTTITLTPLPDDAAVRLTIAADRIVRSITRADANGTAALRVLPGILPFEPPTTEIRRNLVTNAVALLDLLTWQATGGGGTPSMFKMGAGGPAHAPSYVSTIAIGSWTSIDLRVGGATTNLVTAGTTYHAEASFRSSKAGPVKLFVQWVDAAGAVITTIAGTATAVAGTWQKVTVSGAAPANAVRAILITRYDAAVVNGDVLDVTAWLLSTAPGYFIGATLGPDDREYKWAGTPFGSASIESSYAGTITITDYEPAAGYVSYTANGYTSKSAAVALTFDLPGPWIYCPILPSYSVRLESVIGYGARVDSHSTILEGNGRRDPLVILREMGTRAGTIELYAGTYRKALDVLDACSRGEVLMLRQPEHAGMDMYFTAKSFGIVSLQEAGEKTVWGASVDYIEVTRPGGFRAGAIGWTFRTLAGAAPTFADLPNMFASFEDMRLNKRITTP